MAVTITWEQVVAIAPDLATVPVPLQALLLRQVYEIVDATQFCGDETASYEFALLYVAAHFGSLFLQGSVSGAGSTSGPVVSESIGGLSVSYRGSYSTNGDLSRAGWERTPYGATFLDMLRGSPCWSGLGVMVL